MHYNDNIYEKKEPKRKFSVLRGKVIYTCPRCISRVRQFRERCDMCGQALLWDIRVVK